MLKKLKRKFIFINMLLVSVVLVTVLVALSVASQRRSESEQKNQLMRALDMQSGGQPPDFIIGLGGMALDGKAEQHFDSQPVFTVELDENDAIVNTYAKSVTVTDEVAAGAVSAALADAGTKDGRSGKIGALSLMYELRRLPDGKTRIAFLDTSAEDASLAAEMWRNVIIGVAALGAFFLISLFLSNLAVRPVEDAWQKEQQFVADASHELKTPLTVILASLGILEAHRRETIDANKKWLESAQAESERMKHLINDMLFLAKSDAAQTPEALVETDVSDLLWSCLLPFEPIAYEKNVTLDSSIADGVTHEAAAGQLKQLFTILLDNACKYCDPGGRITVTLERDAKQGIIAAVKNTGDPIPEADIPHLFERFYRGDKSRTSGEKPGYGLGLAIAKTAADANRAKLWVRCEGGETGFYVRMG